MIVTSPTTPPGGASPHSTALFPVRQLDRIGEYLREIYGRRAYLWHVPRQELAAQQVNTALGSLWNLLNPMLLIGFYYLIFGLLLDVNRGSDNYITFLAIGVFTFQFTQRSVMSGGNSIINNVGLIRSIQFPRAMLPLSSTLKQFWLHLPTIPLMLAVAIVTGEQIRIAWLLLIPLLAVQTVMSAGFGLIAARAVHAVPDLANLLPIIFRLLFYGSGVLFAVEQRASGRVLYLFQFNPLYDILELNRGILMQEPVSTIEVLSLLIWAISAAVIGIFWFHRDESFYGARN